jgi:hypothetical protein
MADDNFTGFRRPYELNASEVRTLKTFLNEGGADIPVDSELDDETIAHAYGAFHETQIEVPDNILWLLQVAAGLDKRAANGLEVRVPPLWIFYSNAPASEREWLDPLGPGDTIFWIHGKHPRSGAFKRCLRPGDTVLLLVGNEFVASGILLADDQLTFVDELGRIRRPVRILDRFEEPIHRQAVQRAVGQLLSQRGAVHRFPTRALPWLGEELRRRERPSLPYAFDTLLETLSWRSLAADIDAEKGRIRPNELTAKLIEWAGEPWQPSSDPTPENPPPKPGVDPPATGHKPTDDAAGASEEDEEAEGGEPDVQIPFVLDAPADTDDEMDRGTFALFLARRLHLIWCQMNGHAPGSDGAPTKPSPPAGDTFIVHVDSPWGGGKSTFANYVAGVLDPRHQTLSRHHFLRSSLAATTADDKLADISLAEVFVPPYALAEAAKWPGARRPWIIARYNAWREQYVQPPWWQIFLIIHEAVSREARSDAWSKITRRAPWRERWSGIADLRRWLGAQWRRLAYQIWNSKLQTQVWLWLFTAIFLLALWRLGAFAFLAATISSKIAPPDAKKAGDWISLVVAILGLGGVSLATLFTVLGQSLSPDLDFTAEHKQIGVRDPIARFRRAFHKILTATDRPILLIVDDLDRCEPQSVVEILRGFQTIIRSPRLVVLLLGDRAWIETAHDVQHKDLACMGGGEGTLGSLYVQKVIQLSFRLPVMTDDARARYAKRVLGEQSDAEDGDQVTAILRRTEQAAAKVAAEQKSVGERDAELEVVLKDAGLALPADLNPNKRIALEALLRTIATTKTIAAAGADTAQQRTAYNAIVNLIDCLPNNPRQIKRIFMAFAVYEQVGRSLFQYKPAPTGPAGQHQARRWRQLAMWVTLTVEWPETWRAVARAPALLDLAYGEAHGRGDREKTFMEALDEKEQAAAKVVLRRLHGDPSLRTLLSGETRGDLSTEARQFAQTAVEPEAVYEFNRIIWEPGFPLRESPPMP